MDIVRMDAFDNAKAEALFRYGQKGDAHINCAQAVIAFSLLILDLDPDLIDIGRYFGGGIARSGETCGALTGAGISLGIRDYHLPDVSADARAQTTFELGRLARDFAQEFGGCRCIDLTGCDLQTPEGQVAFGQGGSERCPSFVSWVCDRLAPILLAE